VIRFVQHATRRQLLTIGIEHDGHLGAPLPGRGGQGGRAADKVRTPTTWVNPCAFDNPAQFTFGNMGRNSLRADWSKNLDVSVFRNFTIGESKKLEFRMEAFNVTNTPVFAAPSNDVSDSNFGHVSSTLNTERQLQLALKFYF
jgi:hypothetical protein